MQSDRSHYLDYSKGLAIISVLFVHIVGQMDEQFRQHFDQTVNIFKIIINMSYLPLFFIISGSLSAKTINNKLNTLQYCTVKFLKSSLLPFYTLSIIGLLIHIIGSTYGNNYKHTEKMILALLTFTISEDLPSGILWFLFALFLFYMTVLLWERYLKGKMAILLAVSIILKIMEPYCSHIYLFSINHYTESLCYFVFGFYFSSKLLTLTWSWRSVILCLMGYALSSSLYYVEGGRFYLIISSFIGPLSVLIIFRGLEVFNNNIILRALEFIGINSLHVYVFQTACFKFITPMLYRIGLQNSYLGFALWLIMVIICTLMIGEMLSFSPRLYKSIFFRKPNSTVRQAFVFSGR